MWFCIPFTLATTMGLSAIALDLPITLEEAGAGAWPWQPPPGLHITVCFPIGACRASVPSLTKLVGWQPAQAHKVG